MLVRETDIKRERKRGREREREKEIIRKRETEK